MPRTRATRRGARRRPRACRPGRNRPKLFSTRSRGSYELLVSWLTLREPYDRRARNAAVLDAVAAWAAERRRSRWSISPAGSARPAGRTERLPQRQSWRLVDNDLSLLARAGALAKPPD
jgi:hypothetical protein